MIQLDAWGEHERHQADLLAVFEDHQRRYQNSALTVATGWSGPKTFFDDERAHDLRFWIASRLPHGVYEISGWANVMKSGDRVDEHHHRLSHLGGVNKYAGVYYVEPTQAETPLCVQAGDDGGPFVSIVPEPGLLVLFPADRPHYVPQHWYDWPRMSVAFNVRVV